MKRVLFVVGLIGVLAIASRVSEMQTPNPAHFHHVHLNSTDPQKTFEFYEQVFGAKRVKFRDRSDALFTGRDLFVRAFTEKLMMYALGRELQWYDMPRARTVVRGAAAQGYRLSAIVSGIVASDSFRMQATSHP